MSERGEEGVREYNGGVNLFKVHYTHVWKYHNEILVLLMYDKSKILRRMVIQKGLTLAF
jgi:hypothetical protein